MDKDNRYFDMDSLEKNAQSPVAPVPVAKTSGKMGIFIGGMMAGFLVSCVVGCIIYIGISVQNQVQSADISDSTVTLTEGSIIDRDFITKAERVEQLIKQNFYLHEVSEEDLKEGMLKGMVNSLEDVYSEYYTVQELEDLLSDSAGIYFGIGAYVSLDTETKFPKIAGVIAGTPAEKADLRTNDIIYEVDGTSTYGQSLTETVSMIKGERGTQVQLTIVRDGEKLDVSVTREKVEAPTVESEMLDDDMGYLKITEFDDVTTDQFIDAMAVLRGSGMKGLIIDLRSNPGGNLETVVNISKQILPEGMIVYTEDKAGKRKEYKCDGAKKLDIPLVVLVDMNSASASEILAGAIQDYKLGTLVGTTTFGKGIVQSVMPLRDGSAVKLTISSYFTPNGRNIHGTGIEPDVICEFDGVAYYDKENPVDNQLEKAKEVLAGLMK